MGLNDERLQRARIALEGLSVGDALGGFFEFNTALLRLIDAGELPPSPWHYTDDTNMALSIYEILRQQGAIRQDELAASFAEHFDRSRGYEMGARALMARMRKGHYWRDVAHELFKGGSYGNGGAMRVAPVGAYFADDLEAVAENAALSSEITHAHTEGIAGAIAIAIASAIAWNIRSSPSKPTRTEFINLVLPHIPISDVRSGLQSACNLASDLSLRDVVKSIGNGSRVTAQDTVPLALWSAGENLDNYEQAIWTTIRAGGDVDTTCAMVGGIVACYTGIEAIPAEWIAMREPLPDWAFEDK